MSGTFSQIYIQAIFAVKNRECLLKPEMRDEVFKYMAGIITHKGQVPIIINGVSDHVHLFFNLKPAMPVSDLIRDVKNNTSNFVNNKKWLHYKFSWQEGYGAFSYSKSQIPAVIKYIQNQEEHHKKTSFREEYIDFLKKFEVTYDEKYLFDWIA